MVHSRNVLSEFVFGWVLLLVVVVFESLNSLISWSPAVQKNEAGTVWIAIKWFRRWMMASAETNAWKPERLATVVINSRKVQTPLCLAEWWSNTCSSVSKGPKGLGGEKKPFRLKTSEAAFSLNEFSHARKDSLNLPKTLFNAQENADCQHPLSGFGGLSPLPNTLVTLHLHSLASFWHQVLDNCLISF